MRPCAEPDSALSPTLCGQAESTREFQHAVSLSALTAFTGILTELTAQYSEWSDGSDDGANQTVEFLHAETPPGERAVNAVLQLPIALL